MKNVFLVTEGHAKIIIIKFVNVLAKKFGDFLSKTIHSTAVFGLGVFSMARCHALVSLRHAAPPSAMLPFFFFLGLILL